MRSASARQIWTIKVAVDYHSSRQISQGFKDDVAAFNGGDSRIVEFLYGYRPGKHHHCFVVRCDQEVMVMQAMFDAMPQIMAADPS